MESKANTTNSSKFSKILLMGKAGVGKTSIRSIIFANQAPKDTFVLSSTIFLTQTRLQFMGNLSFTLFDCGGQEEFIKQYLETKRDYIFSNVEVLVFVMEAENYQTPKDKDNIEDINYFEEYVNIF